MLKNKLYKLKIYFINWKFRQASKRKGISISSKAKGYRNVSFEGGNGVPDGCNFSGKISIGYATTLGYNNFFHGDINIGKYCQIGAGVAIHTTNHPVHYMTSYINNNLFQGALKELKTNKSTIIGNDVWIGHNVLIIGGANIGNGAIIAAGAVVTKDVEAYTIVAGVPGKPIKKRFSENIIKEIEALHWWNLSNEELEKLKPLFFNNFMEKESIYE